MQEERLMAAGAKTGLGRGLSALIPDSIDADTLVTQGERVEQVALDKLTPNPEQPRTVFDEAALVELAESIRRHGVIQPLVVVRREGGYQIIAGERRWRASKLAGIQTVPVVVRTFQQQEELEVALIENVQRVDLGSLEQALSIERLHQQFNLAYTEVAKRLGKSESTISNIVRLLQLPQVAQHALAARIISEGHARQILALKDLPDKQAELLELIQNNDWSVRQAERFVNSVKDGAKTAQAAQKRVAVQTTETEQLSRRFGTPVNIYRTAKGGKLEIRFSSDEDLKRLLQELTH